MSFKERVVSILTDKGFTEIDFENVFEAMSEILLEAKNTVQEKEPHALNSIHRLHELHVELSDMEYFIDRYTY